jgi:hypothetical protein
MPFKSDAQRKLCYLLKGKGRAGSWDCDEWSTATGKKNLPEHVKKQEEKKAENILVGGAGDKKKPSDFPKGVLEDAIKHEMEHTSNRGVAEEIAIDHLTEDVDYYKKLKKIEGSKSAAMRKLARLWSMPAKISKLAEVATSPGRGEGDKDEGVVNFESSDGIAHAVHKEPNKGPAASLPTTGSTPKPYLARKALIGATKKTFGTNPTGGSILNKMAEGLSYPQQVYNNFANPIKSVGQFGSSFHDIANNIDDSNKSREMAYRQQSQRNNINRDRATPVTSSPAPAPNRNFDFSSIGQKLDPSIIGAPSNQAAAKPVNPISQLGSTLKQVGSAMGDRATGAIRQGATDWAWGPNSLPRLDFVQRGEQVKRQVAGTQRAVGDMANAFKQTASGARAIGNAIPGMAKQSSNVWDTARNVGAGASGAGGALYNAFSGAMGNQQSYDALKEQANKPDFEKGINDWRQSFSAMGQVANNAANYAVPRIAGIALKAHDQYTSDPKYKPTWGQRAENLAVRTGLNSIRSGLPVSSIYNLMTSSGPKGKGILGTGAALTSTALNSVPGAAMTSTALNSVPGAGQVGQAVGQGINQAGQAVGQGIAKGVTNQAINYEAGRRTAGYALPAVEWMRANPWAKYMLGAGGLALGGYALNKMFNRGGEEEQGDEGNPVESNMSKGYNQQAYGTQNHTQPTLNRGR